MSSRVEIFSRIIKDISFSFFCAGAGSINPARTFGPYLETPYWDEQISSITSQSTLLDL